MITSNNWPIYFSYAFSDKTSDMTKAIDLPASVSYPDNVTWKTIPWDTHIENPNEGPNQIVVNGWTFLYGPCLFQISAEVRLYDGTPFAQSHICLYETESSDGPVVLRRNAWEWEVQTNETHSTHLDGSWVGNLVSGRRLRVAVDYWHADTPAKIFTANVQGLYWRY